MGQARGCKWKGAIDPGDEQVTGPLAKHIKVALPRRDGSADIEDEWRQWVVDTLEIANVEQCMM